MCPECPYCKRLDSVIEYIEPRPAEAKHLFADITKVEKLLNWKPKISFQEGIRGYIEQTK